MRGDSFGNHGDEAVAVPFDDSQSRLNGWLLGNDPILEVSWSDGIFYARVVAERGEPATKSSKKPDGTAAEQEIKSENVRGGRGTFFCHFGSGYGSVLASFCYAK